MDPRKLREMFQKQPPKVDRNRERDQTKFTKHKKKKMNGEKKGAKKQSSVQFLKCNRNAFVNKKKPKRLLKSKDDEFKDLHRVSSVKTKDEYRKAYATVSASDATQSIENSAKMKKNSTADQLKGSQFRFLNELLYTQSSEEADQMFKNDPAAFQIYHDGFESQRHQWPKDPLQRVIKFIQRLPNDYVIADFGCGDARLSATLTEKKVHSFDFMAMNDRITACDMRRTPLKAQSVNVAVFCLSLMGTNCNEFIKEASRVLKEKGILKIVEITSRIQRLTRIVNQIEKMGFTCIDKAPADFFIYLTFMKHSPCPKGDLPLIILNPCTYKKR